MQSDYESAMLRHALIEEEEKENKGGKAPKPPCGKCKKAPKAAKATVPKPPTPDGIQPIIPTEADLLVMGRKPNDYVRSWVPPFTKRELYQDNQYTLSGSIYESARNGVCTGLAEMMGVCPWPCQERGANDGSEKYRPKWMKIVDKIPLYDRTYTSLFSLSVYLTHVYIYIYRNGSQITLSRGISTSTVARKR